MYQNSGLNRTLHAEFDKESYFTIVATLATGFGYEIFPPKCFLHDLIALL